MAKRSGIADQLVEAIGLAATEVLIKAYGGKQIVIPSGKGQARAFSDWLDVAMGSQAAAKLRRTFGGERLTVPLCFAQAIAARNRQVVDDYSSGMDMLQLIQKYKRSERQLRTVLNQPVVEANEAGRPQDDRQLGLF
jgi:Mor family transcriptional regulator